MTSRSRLKEGRKEAARVIYGTLYAPLSEAALGKAVPWPSFFLVFPIFSLGGGRRWPPRTDGRRSSRSRAHDGRGSPPLARPGETTWRWKRRRIMRAYSWGCECAPWECTGAPHRQPARAIPQSQWVTSVVCVSVTERARRVGACVWVCSNGGAPSSMRESVREVNAVQPSQ